MKELRFKTALRLALFSMFLVNCVTASVLAQSDPTTGRIIDIDPPHPPGKLKVKQGKGEEDADATEGMIVRRGYRLTLAPEAKAAVLCADNKRHDLIPGPQGCPCVTTRQRVFYEGSPIPRPRGSEKIFVTFPVVVSPRHTSMLTTRPAIRWLPIPGTAPKDKVTYHVSIYTDRMELVWRREVVSQTEMPYPENVAELVRGEGYKVVVQAGSKSSEQDRDADPTFTVLTDDEAKNIKGGETSLRGLNLPEAETQFLVADYYAANGLIAEAVEKLNSLKGASREPMKLRMLGDLYTEVGLTSEALKHYKGALVLMDSPEFKSDLEGRALTLAALGRAYEAVGEDEKSKLRLTEAVAAFQRLGDNVTVQQLRDGKQR